MAKKFFIKRGENQEAQVDEQIETFEEAAEESKTGVKLSPPWITYFQEIKALFGQDKQIHITTDEDSDPGPSIILRVDDNEKYEALTKILPSTKVFGNVIAYVQIYPSNEHVKEPEVCAFAKAFKDNPVVEDILSVSVAQGAPISFVSFKKEVVQFYNDNMQDPNGFESTLYQNIAKDVFENTDGVFFCTAGT